MSRRWAWERWVFALGSLLLGGCSAISLTPPAATDSPSKVRSQCGGKIPAVLFPIADATWVIAGAVEVMSANDTLRGKDVLATRVDSTGNAVYGSEHQPPSEDEARRAELLRLFGYGQIVVGGLSAIYGVYATAKCHSVTNASAETSSLRQERRAEFPAGAYAYHLGMTPSAVEQACRSAGDSFSKTDAQAECESRDPSARPLTHFRFEFGTLEELTLVYRPTRENMNRDFDALERSLRAQFGAPYMRRRLSENCAQMLADCVADGERPRGSSWRWPNGSVTLTPELYREQPAVTLSYRREQADP